MRVLLLLSILFLFACSSIDCPVKNTVAVYYDVKQYDDEGELIADTLKDTLWVWTQRSDGKDTLMNRRTPRAFSRPATSSVILAAIRRISSGPKERKTRVSSTRFRNSGRKV